MRRSETWLTMLTAALFGRDLRHKWRKGSPRANGGCALKATGFCCLSLGGNGNIQYGLPTDYWINVLFSEAGLKQRLASLCESRAFLLTWNMALFFSTMLLIWQSASLPRSRACIYNTYAQAKSSETDLWNAQFYVQVILLFQLIKHVL